MSASKNSELSDLFDQEFRIKRRFISDGVDRNHRNPLILLNEMFTLQCEPTWRLGSVRGHTERWLWKNGTPGRHGVSGPILNT